MDNHTSTFLSSNMLEKVSADIAGKVVLVTGGTGSFGNKFIKVLLNLFDPKKIIIYSRDELKQSVMKKTIQDNKRKLRFLLGDVRDTERLTRAFSGVDIVVHAAALKQVPALEYNPSEAIKTNVLGAMNLIDACLRANVKKLVALSTDKAAAPINLYGATKLCSDKLFVAANAVRGSEGTLFSVVRYGNVFGSRGSIVPVLHQMKPSGAIKLTDVRMTRFNISLEDAVDFVISSIHLMQGGEMFVPKLPSYRLQTISSAICPECTVEIIGRRPGEKLHELMVPSDESYRTVDIGDRFIIEPEGEAAAKYVRSSTSQPVPEGFNYDSGTNSEWNTTEEIKSQYASWCKYMGHS